MIATETAIATDEDLYPRPLLAESGNDATEVLQRSGGVVDVGRPQERQQRLIAAEDVQRQVAVGVVIAVKKAAELMTVQREVGRVQVEHEACGRQQILLAERLYEETLHG